MKRFDVIEKGSGFAVLDENTVFKESDSKKEIIRYCKDELKNCEILDTHLDSFVHIKEGEVVGIWVIINPIEGDVGLDDYLIQKETDSDLHLQWVLELEYICSVCKEKVDEEFDVRKEDDGEYKLYCLGCTPIDDFGYGEYEDECSRCGGGGCVHCDPYFFGGERVFD